MNNEPDDVLDDDVLDDEDPTPAAPAAEPREGEDGDGDQTGDPSGEGGGDDGEGAPPEDRVTLTRAEFQQLLSGKGGDRTPPPAGPAADPLEEDLRSVAGDESIPLHVRRLTVGLARRLGMTEQQLAQAKREARVIQTIPKAHAAPVQELADKFGIPVEVAHQLYKGQLYDRAVERAKSKRGGGAPPATPAAPAPQRRAAVHTSSRPVRSVAPGNAGGGTSTVKIDGVSAKVPIEFESSAAYEKFMDNLPENERARVFAARRSGVAARIRR